MYKRQIINDALFLCYIPNSDGAGHIAAVTANDPAEIHGDEIAMGHNLFCRDTMRHGRILPADDDKIKSGALDVYKRQ